MRVFIGTSGWSYRWNEGKSLDWYVHNTNLNAIELNMSFYRFPNQHMIESWAKKAHELAWIIKVHRSITHYKKLHRECFIRFQEFKRLFKPLEECIHYYLLQLPPPFTNLPNLESFIDEFNSKKLCVEFRNPSLFTEDTIQWAEKKGVLLVSVDAPNLPRKMMSRRVVYERLHGRTHWYTHDYSRNELLEIKNRMIHGQPDRMYIFFNNNHAMLKNAMLMRDLLV